VALACVTRLISWVKRSDSSGFTCYACSSDTPEAIKAMRDEGFVTADQEINRLISEHLKSAV
jgi:hypothetical protein